MSCAAAHVDIGNFTDYCSSLRISRMPPIEPGVYTLCFANAAELAALWWGALPRTAAIRFSLDHGGALTLSPLLGQK